MDEDPLVGLVLAGCRIERPLGRGGMGAVYLARDAAGDEVVVKVLAPEVALDPQVRRRFAREGDALGRLPPHPALVRLRAVAADAEPPAIVMDLVEGAPLSRLARGGQDRLAPLAIARAGRDVAGALAVVHAQGLLHRDVKPANVIVRPDGRATLVDFGVARDAFRSGLTRSGHMVGSTHFMAPEQWRGDPLDARADLYGLGATLYHALTGRPPCTGADPAELMDRVLAGDVAPPRQLAPEVPLELERVVLQLLSADPRFRYPRAGDVADDLERVLAGQPARYPCLVPDGGPRLALLPGRRFTLGRDPGCEVALEHPTVSREHAQLRREDGGWVLRDLRSSYGTRVNDERLAGARALAHGDVVRVGDVRLRFDDPLAAARAVRADAAVAEPAREARAPALVDLLAARGDPRAALALLERLAPDPLEDLAIAALLGQEAAAASAWRPEDGALAARSLARLAGGDPGGLEGWLGWWCGARATLPAQLVPEGRAPWAARVVVGGAARDVTLEAGAPPLQVGRDERCGLVLDHGEVSRLHATLLRLHRRVVVRDEGSRSGTRLLGRPVRAAFVEPHAELALGPVRLRVEAADDLPGLPRAGPFHLVDAPRFERLAALAHPSTATGLVACLHEARAAAGADALARALAPDDAPGLARDLRETLARRAALARAVLPRLLGADPGDDLGAWGALLARRRGGLGPQVGHLHA
ncbi:MAG: FHA domain-containing protein [Planctomycetes bacterium]|nr:FHA domain-containing protein [Planctomycetota bacterium]